MPFLPSLIVSRILIVICDDTHFGADDLQKLTYYLCFVYATSTQSICVPAPVQYAHLAAHRSRLHIIGYQDSETSSGSISVRGSVSGEGEEKVHSHPQKKLNLVESLNGTVKVKDDVRQAMYFC